MKTVNEQEKKQAEKELKAKLKAEKVKAFEEKMENLGGSFEKGGKGLSKAGGMLTMAITVPVLLTLFLGPLGFALSVAIVAIMIFGKKKK